MTIWEQLEIGVTRDLKVIRSAYAAKAKELHPEEHPEEFQELQKAYKAAVKYAKTGGAAVKFTKEEDSAVRVETIKPEEIKTEDIKLEEVKQEEPKPEEIRPEMLKPEEQKEEEQMFEYDYQEIQGETLSEQFFQDFFYIAWNPWLLNNRICWDLFLHRPQYKVLFEDKDFRKNLVMTMCMLSGWHRNTIRYFDSFLKSFQKEGEGKAETDYFYWKWKKNRLLNKGLITTEKWITKEQKELQNILISAAGKKIGVIPREKKEKAEFFEDRRAVAVYLQTYLNYAPKHAQRLEKMYQTNKTGKSFARSMFLVLLFWLCLLVYINLTGDVPKKQTEQEKRQEEWEQEREDNIKKYLEELDYVD